MEESLIYYQNNLRVFQNGMSMLTINALESHGFMH